VKQLAAEFSYSIPQNVQLFGENMFGVHSLEYDRLESYFYLFAGLEDGSRWMSWDHMTELANEITVPTVPVVARKKVKKIVKSVNFLKTDDGTKAIKSSYFMGWCT